MNNTKRTFKYQPKPVSSLIVWSWTGLILMLGIIYWLEILKFNWLLVAIVLVFILAVTLQVSLRRVSIDRNLLIFSTVFNRSWLVIPRDQLESIRPVRGGIKVKIDKNEYQFLMTKKSRESLIKIVQNA